MIIFYAFVVIYISLIAVFVTKYNKIEYFSKSCNEKTYISIIVPFRNEKENLPKLINSINKQNYNPNFFEVIFIDDCSEDQSSLIIEKQCKIENFKIVKIEIPKGKKNALEQGFKIAKGQVIVTTDADCTMKDKWLETINSYYSKYKPKMIIMPVELTSTKKMLTFTNLQYVEFTSLQASTLAAVAINKPIMCNGANLAFEKQCIENIKNPLKKELISGDDMFLMFKILEKYPKQIQYLKNQNVVVTTKATKTLKDFLKQRTRWAYKAKFYSNFFALFVSLFVFLSNLSILLLFVFQFFNFKIFLNFIILFGIKFLFDNIIIYKHLQFLNKKKLIILTPIITLFYPLYIVSTAFLSIFLQTKWKK